VTPTTDVPVPGEGPWTLEVLGEPAAALIVFGEAAPQGSKRHVGGGRMIESSKKVAPWRKAVYEAARAQSIDWCDQGHVWDPLDGPLVADFVFTMPKGSTLPKWRDWHDKVPDLSKLARSTEDALTGVVWADDARVTAYRRLEKRYVGSDDPDTLPIPGAVIRVWTVPTPLIEARRASVRHTPRSNP